MSYNYVEEVAKILTAEHFSKILKAKDKIDKAIQNTEVITYGAAMGLTDFNDSFLMRACLDYLVEQGLYLKCPLYTNAAWQHHVLWKRKEI